VAIQGAASRTIFRTQPLSLFCAASISPCSKARTLAYTWRIAGPGSTSLALGPTNTDPRFFRVPTNRLTPNGVYEISVSVRDSLGMAANASVQVLVGRSPLTAVIDGGDRTVGQAIPFSLVGSSSRDPDGTAYLAYTWGCTRGGAAYGKACGFPLTNNATVQVPGGQALGSYLFTLTVADPLTARSASASVSVTIIADQPPATSITGLAAVRVNPSSKLSLTSTVADPSANFTATWSLSSGSLLGGQGLGDAARTPLSRVSRTATGEASFLLPLVLAAGVLAPRATYTLSLRAWTADGRAGTSTLTFVTAGPPTSGYVEVAPSEGYAVITAFAFRASSWADDEPAYPLKYSFAYAIGPDGGTEYQLTSDADLSAFAGVYLPQGQAGSGLVTAVGYVKNQFAATARATAAVTVGESTLPIR
jgi:hypothetical protein